MRIAQYRHCWVCGTRIKDTRLICDECRWVLRENLRADSDERGRMAHECVMCGKYCASVDKTGHCSSCRQVWDG